MTTLDDSDYYGMEDFLMDSNLKLYTNDWPGNDPLTNVPNQSPGFNELDNYLPVSQENFASSTDSGNHSPISSSSDSHCANYYEWNTADTTLISPHMNTPPTPVDLEAIELLLNEKPIKQTYYPEQVDEAYDDSQPSDVFYADDQFYFEEQLSATPRMLSNQQDLSNNTYKVIKSPQSVVNKSIRPSPYTVIRPNRASSTTSVQSVPIIPVTTNSVSPPATITNNSTLMQQPKYVICNQPNNIKQVTPNTILVSPVMPVSTTMNYKKETNNNVTRINNDYLKKSEERKRRNRESAQISRERKKLEFEQMKTRITDLESENKILKEKLSNCKCSRNINNKNVTGAKAIGITLLALCAVVTFTPLKNLSPIENTIPQQITYNATNSTNAVIHIGSRALLAVNDYNYDNVSYDTINNSTKSSSNETDYPNCSFGSLNTSQLIKVNNDLINWIDRHEKMNLVQLRSGNSPYLIYNSHKQLTIPDYHEYNFVNSTNVVNVSQTIKKFEKKRKQEQNMKERAWRHIGMIRPKKVKADDNALIPVSVQEQIMKQLAAQLKQNEDTLYVMALKDYIILPRISAKSGESPKISLVLPALSLNSSLSNHIPMMRIECTVSSTNLFFLPERLVSLFNGSSGAN